MSRSKVPTYLGVAAAGGLGYYLYTAGGSPSAAAKQAKGEFSYPTKLCKQRGLNLFLFCFVLLTSRVEKKQSTQRRSPISLPTPAKPAPR